MVSSGLAVLHLHLAGDCLGPFFFLLVKCDFLHAVMGCSKQSISCHIQCVHAKAGHAILAFSCAQYHVLWKQFDDLNAYLMSEGQHQVAVPLKCLGLVDY